MDLHWIQYDEAMFKMFERECDCFLLWRVEVVSEVSHSVYYVNTG